MMFWLTICNIAGFEACVLIKKQLDELALPSADGLNQRWRHRRKRAGCCVHIHALAEH